MHAPELLLPLHGRGPETTLCRGVFCKNPQSVRFDQVRSDVQESMPNDQKPLSSMTGHGGPETAVEENAEVVDLGLPIGGQRSERDCAARGPDLSLALAERGPNRRQGA